MHDNDGPSIRQKPISKNHNKLDKIIHSHVLKTNEGKRFKDMQNWKIKWYVC